MPKSERDRVQVDLTGTNLRDQIEELMRGDPIYQGRSMVAVIRMLLELALSGEEIGQPAEAEIMFLQRLEQKQWLSEVEIVDVAAELEVSPELLIELQGCVKEGKRVSKC
jgi:hypothetical protein